MGDYRYLLVVVRLRHARTTFVNVLHLSLMSLVHLVTSIPVLLPGRPIQGYRRILLPLANILRLAQTMSIAIRMDSILVRKFTR